MPLSKIADARKLSDEEISTEILAAKRKLFELRLQQATRRLEKPHEFRHTRHRLAQLMTVERERQLNITPTGIPCGSLKPAIAFFARVTMGFCPVMVANSLIEDSKALAFCDASPSPRLTVTLMTFGTS